MIWALSFEDFERLILGDCHYCGRTPQTIGSPYLSKSGKVNGKVSEKRAREVLILHNGIDRKDNTKGYLLDNCVTCCETCNRGKRAMSYEDFQKYLDDLVKYRG